MQNTQQNSFAEYVINMVCDFMNYCRGNMSITDMFTPTLAVLYAIARQEHRLLTERFLMNDTVLILVDRFCRYRHCCKAGHRHDKNFLSHFVLWI